MAKLKLFGEEIRVPPAFVGVETVRLEDVVMTPLVRLACQSCGGWGRKATCPPVMRRRVEDTIALLREYKWFHFLVFQTDGTVSWRLDGTNPDLGKYRKIRKALEERAAQGEWSSHSKRALRGVHVGLSSTVLEVLAEIREKLSKKKDALYFGTTCKRCPQCRVLLGKKCKSPRTLFHQADCWGVDIYATLKERVSFQIPIRYYITEIATIACNRRELLEVNHD